MNCSLTRLNISWIAVEFPRNVTVIFNPFGGISPTDDLMLFGIHSTKYDEFLTFNTCSSTSFVDVRPRKFRVGTVPMLSKTCHDIIVDLRRPSRSLHQTSAASIRWLAILDIAGNHATSIATIQPRRNEDVGMGSCSLRVYEDPMNAPIGNNHTTRPHSTGCSN